MIDGAIFYYERFGARGVLDAFRAKCGLSNSLIRVKRENVTFPFHLRYRSSDISTYDQIFSSDSYRFRTKRHPEVILDAGANVGLASIYFANRYPDAKIFAVEPEKENFQLLRRNVTPYPNVVPIEAALWGDNGDITLIDPGHGNWGFMTQGTEKTECRSYRVRGITVAKLMERYSISKIDILKMDIEGSEKEVFETAASWIDSVDSVVVELHEDLRAGCTQSFRNATKGFEDRWTQGQNSCASQGNCLAADSG